MHSCSDKFTPFTHASDFARALISSGIDNVTLEPFDGTDLKDRIRAFILLNEKLERYLKYIQE